MFETIAAFIVMTWPIWRSSSPVGHYGHMPLARLPSAPTSAALVRSLTSRSFLGGARAVNASAPP